MPGVKDRVSGADFNRRIQLQSDMLTQAGDGTSTDSWTTVYTCWANIQFPPHGRGLTRLMQFGQLYWNVNAIIQIRFQKTVVITDKMRILYPAHGINRIFKIIGIENTLEANVSIWLLCQE